MTQPRDDLGRFTPAASTSPSTPVTADDLVTALGGTTDLGSLTDALGPAPGGDRP